MVFESKSIQWQALNNAKEALKLIKGIESKLEDIVKSEQICINFVQSHGGMTDKELVELKRLQNLHLNEESSTKLRRAATSIKRMIDIQSTEGEINNYDN
jgi:hypothetical protein